MTRTFSISEELLGAYMDGELGPDEEARVIQALNEDPELRAYHCRLRRLRARLHEAYPLMKEGERRRGPWRRGGVLGRTAVAAGLVLVGLAGGWSGHAILGPQSGQAELSLSRVLHAPQEAQQQDARMMLHVTTGREAAIGEALQEVEGLLREYQRMNQDLSLRVVVNGDGLSMLRADESPHPDWIRRIRNEHDNVQFQACQNAIDRVEREEGRQVELLPEAEVVPVAMAEIIQRQREGWSYIKI